MLAWQNWKRLGSEDSLLLKEYFITVFGPTESDLYNEEQFREHYKNEHLALADFNCYKRISQLKKDLLEHKDTMKPISSFLDFVGQRLSTLPEPIRSLVYYAWALFVHALAPLIAVAFTVYILTPEVKKARIDILNVRVDTAWYDAWKVLAPIRPDPISGRWFTLKERIHEMRVQTDFMREEIYECDDSELISYYREVMRFLQAAELASIELDNLRSMNSDSSKAIENSVLDVIKDLKSLENLNNKKMQKQSSRWSRLIISILYTHLSSQKDTKIRPINKEIYKQNAVEILRSLALESENKKTELDYDVIDWMVYTNLSVYELDPKRSKIAGLLAYKSAQSNWQKANAVNTILTDKLETIFDIPEQIDRKKQELIKEIDSLHNQLDNELKSYRNLPSFVTTEIELFCVKEFLNDGESNENFLSKLRQRITAQKDRGALKDLAPINLFGEGTIIFRALKARYKDENELKSCINDLQTLAFPDGKQVP